jgi:tripartite-type tricarboxylate transporter receptor subunit TctC
MPDKSRSVLGRTAPQQTGESRRKTKGRMAMRRRALIAAFGLALLWPGVAGLARAESYPNRPVKLVLTFAAGGAADLFARAFANALGAQLGQQVFVESHVGAGGLTGVDYTAKSPADGYTICFAGAAALSAMPFMMTKMPFDWQKDLTLITNVVRVPEAIVVSPALGTDTLAAFVDYAHKHPGKINFGSAGMGTITQLGAELLKDEAHIDIVHVPYRGVAPAVTDLLGGQLQMLVADVPFVLPQIKAGSLKALALTSATRVSALPDLPTTGEAGYPRVNSDNWYGLVAPAGIPPEALERLHQASMTVLNSPEIKKQFDTFNASPAPMSRQQFAAFILTEQAKWGPLVLKTGVRLE